jgi:hypothetical protein
MIATDVPPDKETKDRRQKPVVEKINAIVHLRAPRPRKGLTNAEEFLILVQIRNKATRKKEKKKSRRLGAHYLLLNPAKLVDKLVMKLGSLRVSPNTNIYIYIYI